MAHFIGIYAGQLQPQSSTLSRIVAGWNAFRARRRERDRIIREMNAYSDRELADLGFSREDIWDVANGTYRR